MFKAYESYNPPYTLPPVGADITGIYGTVINADKSRQAVKILFVYLAYGNGSQPPQKMVMVQGLHRNAIAFSVPRKQLVFIQVFAIVESR
jgi:hypothetical protein